MGNYENPNRNNVTGGGRFVLALEDFFVPVLSENSLRNGHAAYTSIKKGDVGKVFEVRHNRFIVGDQDFKNESNDGLRVGKEVSQQILYIRWIKLNVGPNPSNARETDTYLFHSTDKLGNGKPWMRPINLAQEQIDALDVITAERNRMSTPAGPDNTIIDGKYKNEGRVLFNKLNESDNKILKYLRDTFKEWTRKPKSLA